MAVAAAAAAVAATAAATASKILNRTRSFSIAPPFFVFVLLLGRVQLHYPTLSETLSATLGRFCQLPTFSDSHLSLDVRS